MNMKDKVKNYMKLPYTKVIKEVTDESGHYYHGWILELDGCQSTGETIEELNKNLTEAMEGYIEVKLENGLYIPEPEKDNGLSHTSTLPGTQALRSTLGMVQNTSTR